jgi:hypothetical protein
MGTEAQKLPEFPYFICPSPHATVTSWQMYCNYHEKEIISLTGPTPGMLLPSCQPLEVQITKLLIMQFLLYLLSPSMGSTITVPTHTNFLLHVHFPAWYFWHTFEHHVYSVWISSGVMGLCKSLWSWYIKSQKLNTFQAMPMQKFVTL